MIKPLSSFIKFIFSSEYLFQALNAKKALRKIIAECLTQSENNNTTSGELSSVLQRLIADQGKTAGNETLILDIIIDLLFSSAQTVSSAGCSIAHKLSTHSEFIEKVQDDINRQNLSDTHEAICNNDVTEMTYVNAIVKETLRLVPPVGGGYRSVKETFELDVSLFCYRL